MLPGDPLAGAAVWMSAAAALSALPSRRRHRPWAFALIAAGLPILRSACAAGWARGLVAPVVGLLVLRWPARAALRRPRGGRGR